MHIASKPSPGITTNTQQHTHGRAFATKGQYHEASLALSDSAGVFVQGVLVALQLHNKGGFRSQPRVSLGRLLFYFVYFISSPHRSNFTTRSKLARVAR